jgi:hypothetical protein
MKGVTHGSASQAGARNRGWFVGRFIRGARHDKNAEVKWGVHPRGQTNGSSAANRRARTLSILIEGRFRLLFRKGRSTTEIVLKNPGDFAQWDRGVAHDWHALEDSIVLTVRWPSLPDDQR